MITSCSTKKPRRYVCIESCSDDDTVMILWDPVHCQYIIYQVSGIISNRQSVLKHIPVD